MGCPLPSWVERNTLPAPLPGGGGKGAPARARGQAETSGAARPPDPLPPVPGRGTSPALGRGACGRRRVARLSPARRSTPAPGCRSGCRIAGSAAGPRCRSAVHAPGWPAVSCQSRSRLMAAHATHRRQDVPVAQILQPDRVARADVRVLFRHASSIARPGPGSSRDVPAGSSPCPHPGAPQLRAWAVPEAYGPLCVTT